MSASKSLLRSSPEAQGLPSRAVTAWLDALATEDLELHSFMLLRSGAVVAEGWWAPYSPERTHQLYSLSKSFTSIAIGLLVADVRLGVEDKVIALFPEARPEETSPHLETLRLHDLLTMRTGHAEDVTGALFETPNAHWNQTFLSQPLPFPPGTHFVYNSAATFMLSALVQRLTGETLLDFLQHRLFQPLGIEHARWTSNQEGINYGGWGLQLTTEGVARFGQFLLQRGNWEQKQLLPEAWIAEATRAQVPPGDELYSDWAQGYGFQFWRCRHAAYRADGAFGQFCIVMPEQQAVLVITANVQNMQRVLDLVWLHLLPAMSVQGKLPEDISAQTVLRARCSALQLTFLDISSHWDGLERNETFAFAPNREGLSGAQLSSDRDSCRLTFTNEQGEHPIECGLTDWHANRIALWENEEVILARVGQTPGHALTLILVMVESGFHWRVDLDEEAGTLTLTLPPTLASGELPLIARHTTSASGSL